MTAALLLILAALLPDVVRTPGAFDPRVTEANLRQTICTAGWTKKVRPSVRYTNRLKRLQMTELALPGAPKDYEEDHLIPLELGGAPTDARNLYPQPWPDARRKDKVETRLHRQVCSGAISLDAAREAIRHWPEQH